MLSDEEQNTAGWYARYYARVGAARNDLLANPEMDLQWLYAKLALIRALRRQGVQLAGKRILDVGCGAGASLLQFLELGAHPDGLFGIDIQDARVAEARRRFGFLTVVRADAREIPFDSQGFDLCFASGMFVQIVEDDISRAIAREMIRCTRIDGLILIRDWSLGKPWDRGYRALDKRRILALFGGAAGCRYLSHDRGALVPVLGRPLSRFLPVLYPLVTALVPVLAAFGVTVLRREH